MPGRRLAHRREYKHKNRNKHTVDLVVVALEAAVFAKGPLLQLLQNLFGVRHVALGGKEREGALHFGDICCGMNLKFGKGVGIERDKMQARRESDRGHGLQVLRTFVNTGRVGGGGGAKVGIARALYGHASTPAEANDAELARETHFTKVRLAL